MRMSEYISHLKELAATGCIYFDDLSLFNRSHAYSLKLKHDHAWIEEILVGEGQNPDVFLNLLITHMLSFTPLSTDNRIALQAHFFELCESYLYETVADDYEQCKTYQ